jgi:hypothetical protein
MPGKAAEPAHYDIAAIAPLRRPSSGHEPDDVLLDRNARQTQEPQNCCKNPTGGCNPAILPRCEIGPASLRGP